MSFAPATNWSGDAQAGGGLADRTTPLIRNCWYFVALGQDVTRKMVSRTVLGVQVLLYRTEAGQAVALHDRCPHRSFPLSKGRLNDDVVICGYHGMQFDETGRCQAIPANPAADPGRIVIRSFPLAEKGPILWIWMGDPSLAKGHPTPDCGWMRSPDWSHQTGTFTIDATYVAMHENLLDTTHFAFLHSDTVGTPEYAQSSMKVQREADRVGVLRELHDHPAPPAFDRLMGLRGRPVTRRSDACFISPGASFGHAWFENPAPEPGERGVFDIRLIHLITPITQGRFHYQYFVGRNFLIDDPEADDIAYATAKRAFLQDVEALQWIEEVVDREGADFRELSFISDRPGLEMRRIIAKLAAAEAVDPN